MSRAGYITDNTCPINTDHGVCVRISDYMYCPHHEHDMNFTRNRWPMQMWEDVKNGKLPTGAPATPTTSSDKPLKIPEKRPK